MTEYHHWTLNQVPLDYFRFAGFDYFCCDMGIHQLDPKSEPAELMATDEEDMFVSDLEIQSACGDPRSLKLVYKYKKPATAFCTLEINDHLLIFSLHKRNRGFSQSQPSFQLSFYVECTAVDSSGNLQCRNANVALFDVDYKTVSNNSDSRVSDENWLHVTSANRVQQNFVTNDIGFRRQLSRNHLVMFLRVKEDPRHLQAVIINESQDVEHTIRIGKGVLSDCNLNRKINFILNSSVFDHSLKTQVNSGDKIQDLLSRQKPSVRDFENVLWCRTDLVDVGTFQSGFLILDSGGNLWQYLKKGKEVQKVKIPIANASRIYCEDSIVSVVTRQGIVYRVHLPYVESKVTADHGSDGTLEKYLKAAEALKASSLEKSELEIQLQQLRLALHLDDNKDETLFAFESKVVSQNDSFGLCSYNLALKLIFNQDKQNLKLLGKYWHLLITITPGQERDRIFVCQAVPIPNVLDDSVASLEVFHNLQKEFLSTGNLPLKVELSLCLTVSKFSMRSRTLAHFDLTTIHFLTVGSKKQNSKFSFEERNVAAECSTTETFEEFLENLNRNRPAYRVFCGTEVEAARKYSNVKISLSSDLIKRNVDKPLFEKLSEIIGDEPEQVRNEWNLLTTIFGTEVRFTVVEHAEDSLLLSVESPNPELLLAIKRDFYNVKLKDLEESYKSHIDIPFEIVRKFDDLKSFLASIEDETEEKQMPMLETAYSYLRKHVSVKLN